MTNETLSKKLPSIISHICKIKISSKDFIAKSCLLFRNDNFKFINMRTSNSEEKEASAYIQQIDDQFDSYNVIFNNKMTQFNNIFNKESSNLLLRYCIGDESLLITNHKLFNFNKIKNNLKTMIKNYFKIRNELYGNIVKEVFNFDHKSNEIVSLNSKLTYKTITQLSQKARIILIDLYISVFTSLNMILTDISNEVNNFTGNKTTQEMKIGGAATKKYRKRNNYTRNLNRI